MFGNLIESGSHAADLKRRGRFFIYTTIFYGLLLLATGVGSIYAYNVHIDEGVDEYVILSMMRFPPSERSEPARREAARPAASRSDINQIASRKIISILTPYREKDVAPQTAKDIGPRTPVVLGLFDSDPIHVGNPSGTNNANGYGGVPGGGNKGPVVGDDGDAIAPPVVIKHAPVQTPQKPTGPIRLPSDVLTGKAISMPAPPYPSLAKQTHIQGAVTVQILIDEQGRVVSARATSGPPMLQAAAQQAAVRARFTPTLLSGQPVKVTGVITYNFVLQ